MTVKVHPNINFDTSMKSGKTSAGYKISSTKTPFGESNVFAETEAMSQSGRNLMHITSGGNT